jgi:DNA mismatch repair protein MutS2
MTFPNELEEKLGFDQIRQMLRTYCSSSASEERVDDIHFLTDAQPIGIALRQTLEFKQILEKSETFPSQHFHNPAEWFKKIFPEGNYLDAHELLDLARSLETIQACKSFLTQTKDSYPELFTLAEPVRLSGKTVGLIYSKIDERAWVKDGASVELTRVRKRLKEEQTGLRKLSDQIFRRAVGEKWVPEGALPTIREGRLVIPLLAEHKKKIRGLILDESATGQTIFMEPAEMLDANNEIRELEHAEKREVIRILKLITGALREQYEELALAFDFLTAIDFVRAKAKLAVAIYSILPRVVDHPALSLLQAKHPLLYLSLKGKREVIPLDIDLEEKSRMLLVSGPNAGGKSVCLKTVGLLQYMMQCGLLVPVSERSIMGIFDSIFLDIGDQQSIENDLSTYSSHLSNMSTFVRQADGRSLVLIDELGSGTDPNFGGAIAEAVLKSLLRKQVWGVATTHYYNLKVFAGQHDGIRNAAMRFDEKNLMPLYVLDIGKPGSSFAIEIARKTGLPPETLREAESLVGKELAGFETLVRKLEQEQRELREKVRGMEKHEAELNQSLHKYTMLSAELEARKKEIIEKAKIEARTLLQDTNREIEKTIRHIRENRAEKKETQRVRKNLQQLSGRITVETRHKSTPSPVEAGDSVRIVGQEGSGVVQMVKDKNAVVQFGEIKSVIDLRKLEKIAPSATHQAVSGGKARFSILEKRAAFKSTLDLRGMRAGEVAPALDQFMDTAILLGVGELRILHGKGAGVLRKVVREQLKQYMQVVSFGDEHIERGGDGITVAILK